MKTEYETLINEYDKLMSICHRNAYLDESKNALKWKERIDEMLDHRLRLMKLQLQAEHEKLGTYHDSEPAEYDEKSLPHLQYGGSWKAKNGIPERRYKHYLGWLLSLGMLRGDAIVMMQDLYWDCYAELLETPRFSSANSQDHSSQKD